MNNKEQAILLAKRLMVDSIWKSANLEGLGTTFPKTEMILENLEVDTSREEVFFVVNMKRAWEFLLSNVGYTNSLAFLRELNKVVGNGLFIGNGEVRKLPVSIGGTDWCPSIPDLPKLYEDIDKLESIEDSIDKALNYFCFICRSQIFLDGNKRVAQLMANKILIENGIGIFQVPINAISRFKSLLIEYYESGNSSKIIHFMKNYCIRGIDGNSIKYIEDKENENVDTFIEEDVSQDFVLSQAQCNIMNSVLRNIRRLLLSKGLRGSWILCEEWGKFILKSDSGSVSIEAWGGDIVVEGSLVVFNNKVLSDFIIKTIILLNDRVPFSVKSLHFSVDSTSLSMGYMRDSVIEEGSIDMFLE